MEEGNWIAVRTSTHFSPSLALRVISVILHTARGVFAICFFNNHIVDRVTDPLDIQLTGTCERRR